jgi:hypothetical protein
MKYSRQFILIPFIQIKDQNSLQIILKTQNNRFIKN